MRILRWLGIGATWCALGGCAAVSLGVDEQAVPVGLDRVVWSESVESGQHHGLLTLVEDAPPGEVWRLHLKVPDRLFEERGAVDWPRLPLGSRVYLLDPDDIEYRGRAGTLVLSRRGGGALAGGFGRPGEPTSVELELSWTSWHVSDRRHLGTPGDDTQGPSPVR